MSGKIFAATAAVLASSALAAPVESAPLQPAYFTATIPVHYDNIFTSDYLNPNNGTIWAGKPVATACPQGQPEGSTGCPPVNSAGVYYLKDGSLFLGTSQYVTQQAYIDAASGVLKFNKVGEPLPSGAYTSGFSQDADSGALSYGDYQVWACQAGGEQSFNVVFDLENVYINSYFCGGTPAGIATKPASGPGAFEYV